MPSRAAWALQSLGFFLPAEGCIYQAICSKASTARLPIPVLFAQTTGMLNKFQEVGSVSQSWSTCSPWRRNVKVFFFSCLQMSPVLNLSVTDVIQSEFAAHCSGAHVLAYTHSLLLWVQCRGRFLSRGGREVRIWPLVNLSHICKRNTDMHLVGERCPRA